MPGIYFSFVRECGATGAGIVVAPKVRAALAPVIGEWNPIPAKIISGIIGGMFCSLMTQWLHNNSLRAGNIYQYTGQLPSTLEVLDLTWKELGYRMFYLNADRRVLSTATATTAQDDTSPPGGGAVARRDVLRVRRQRGAAWASAPARRGSMRWAWS